jgi:SAM-dependent methyltransferase
MLEAGHLRAAVRDAYSVAAENPRGKHAFPVGRAFAESVGYGAELLDSLPAVSVEAFAGVSNVSVFAELPTGATVLDLGCGGGLDALVAARRVGASGCVIGVDFSASMLARARRAADEAQIGNVEFKHADGESLPLADASVDAVLVNGIFNLNPARRAIFGELGRVLRVGGAAWVAELVLSEPLPEDVRADPSNWFA